MNHFFVEPSQIVGKEIRIFGEDVNHIKNVLRMRPGEEISVSNGADDKEYRCGIVEVTESEVICELRFVKENAAELPLRITLFQGIPKGDKMELIIQKAVELGAAALIPLDCSRCVVRLDAKKSEKKRERWQGIAEAAAKQSRRSIIPQIGPCMNMKEAAEAAGKMRFALIPYELAEGMESFSEFDAQLRDAQLDAGDELAIFIGPEGGFSDEEIALAKAAGITPVSLGRRILRTETAGMCLLSHLGVVAEGHLRSAKESLSSLLRCKPEELIFTSGGTESDNLALLGAARANKRKGTHLITSQIEHPAVLRTMEQLASEGFDVTYLPVDHDGIVSIEALERSVSEDTILVSVMHTNNEIGAKQPLAEIGTLLKRKYPDVLFHVDAVQGFGKEPIRPKELGIDLMSVSAHKFHGPKGVGFLYAAARTKLAPLILGGGQQNGMRSGTENVPGIAGMALAAQRALEHYEEDEARAAELRKFFVAGLSELENVKINGGEAAAHIVSASFAGVRAEVLLHALEEKEIYVSAGSACATHKPEPSRTLQAIGLSKDLLEGTLRFSFSRFTTKEELETTLAALCEILPELRKYTRR